MTVRQKVLRRSLLTAKSPHCEMSLRRSVLTAKCPNGEVSYGNNSGHALNASAVRHFRAVWQGRAGEDGEMKVEGVMVTQPTVERL